MGKFKTIYRGVDGSPGWKDLRATETGNATGYFVQNEHGATVAGPFSNAQEAWRAEARLNDRGDVR